MPCNLQAVVAAFEAPAPPTQAAFFFHATETWNPCQWATDFDISQVDYVPFPGQPPCPGCKVRQPPSCGYLTIATTTVTISVQSLSR